MTHELALTFRTCSRLRLSLSIDFYETHITVFHVLHALYWELEDIRQNSVGLLGKLNLHTCQFFHDNYLWKWIWSSWSNHMATKIIRLNPLGLLFMGLRAGWRLYLLCQNVCSNCLVSWCKIPWTLAVVCIYVYYVSESACLHIQVQTRKETKYLFSRVHETE
jgi:hypothetical protein